MKRKILFLMLSFCIAVVSAQNESASLVSNYDRSSISLLIVNNQDIVDFSLLTDKIKNFKEFDKYDLNPLNSYVVSVDNPKNIEYDAIQKFLVKQKYGNQIIDFWFNKDVNGLMSPDIFLDRGLYNAKDEDVIRSHAMKRGLDYVKDYGENLIGNSHVIVLRIDNIIKVQENTGLDQLKSLMGKGKFRLFKSNYRGYVATVTAFLYRINFDKSQREYFYQNCWIYPEDSEEIKKQKMECFNQMNIGFTFVKKETFMSKRIKEVQKFPLNIFIRKPSYDKLMDRLSEKIQEETIAKLARDYEQFEVKVPVYNVNPISAKVGKKEGLRPDDRFFVYEYSIDEKSNKPIVEKVAEARASNTVDNRHVATGSTAQSKFRQTWGLNTEPGLLMIEKNDFGYSGSFGYEVGKMQGFFWKADVLLGRAWRFPISNIYFSVSGAYETVSYSAWGFDYNNQKRLRYTYSLTYPFYIGYNINLKPFGGLCADGPRKDINLGDGASASAWIAGLDVSYGFKSSLELYGGATYYGFYDYSGWDDYYDARKGLSFRIGLRFSL
jgi:hypothetical protein